MTALIQNLNPETQIAMYFGEDETFWACDTPENIVNEIYKGFSDVHLYLGHEKLDVDIFIEDVELLFSTTKYEKIAEEFGYTVQ